jgi:prepilin-type N-terminal cleavage/methylation domain
MRSRGFTLVELVVVIVLLGIVGVISFRFIGQTVQLYSDSTLQQQRIAEARFVQERLSREIAGSHPFSLRDPFANDLSFKGKCIEYIRVAAVGAYTGSATASMTLNVLDNPTDLLQAGSVGAMNAARRVSIHSQDASDLYASADTNTVKSVTAFSSLNHIATFASVFTSDSTGKRYVVLDATGPVSWCLFNNQLYRYSNYNPDYTFSYAGSWFATEAKSGSAYSSLMVEHVSPSTLFQIIPSSLDHNAELDLSLQLSTDSEGDSLTFNRRMPVNYVP